MQLLEVYLHILHQILSQKKRLLSSDFDYIWLQFICSKCFLPNNNLQTIKYLKN